MFDGFDGWLRVQDEATPLSPEKPMSVSEFIEQCNFTLETEYDRVLIEGEVASFKVNQNKWVFFDLKEGESSLNCFMPLAQLNTALVDGMKIRIRAVPRVTRWGRFSLTVRQIVPVGEGNIKKSFELLKKKLTAEGLFDPRRKRPLPPNLTKIGVISSVNAAGYHDFLKILDNRWSGLRLQVINTQVQGMAAAAQIIHALDYFNQHPCLVEVVVILRGGGGADDLATFNDELLARAIAASRLPVVTGIGHEVDESLADLVADVRASTPSNAAERLSPDRHTARQHLALQLDGAKREFLRQINTALADTHGQFSDMKREVLRRLDSQLHKLAETQKVLASLDPEAVLRRGYAIISAAPPGQPISVGTELKLTTFTQELITEVKHVQNRTH